MHSSNPVFARTEGFNRNGGYADFDAPASDRRRMSSGEAQLSDSDLQGMYDAPSATQAQQGRMTLDDVVIRTATLFAVLLATAAPTYFLAPQSLLIVLGAGLVGFGLAMAVTFSKKVRPALMLAYAAVQGVFVGGISSFYGLQYGDDLVPQAVLGTLAAFTGMLLAYRSGIIRNSPKFQRTLMIAGIGYLVFALFNIVSVFVFDNTSVYQMGLLGIAISAFGVVLASLFLVLDFDFIEKGIKNGLPQQYAWTAAFGLLVTLVWLYLEILRLIALLRGDN